MPIANMKIVNPTGVKEEAITKRVYFNGDTAVKKGQALVYDFMATVAGVAAPHIVRTPSSSYTKYFAGVARQDYPAVTGGQFIDIAVPGSICQCLVAPAGTGGTTEVVMSQTDGKFGVKTSEVGCGTALMLEDVASPTTAGKLVYCKLLEGTDCTAPAFSAGSSSSSSSAIGG